MSSANILLLLVKAPTGFSLALPQPDANGVSTATATQLAIHEATESAFIEWNLVGSIKTLDLFRVVARVSLADIEGMIAAYHLPLAVIHAQDAYQKQTGTTTATDGTVTPVMTTTVYRQASKTAVLPFMPDVITYDPVTMKVVSKAKATTITIPNCQDMAAWNI